MFKSQFKWQLMANNEVNNEKELMEILFKNRKLTSDIEKSHFFTLDFPFYDPYLFNEMHTSVNRLNEAINKQEKIMIYGDFDVDGVTGVAILYKALKKRHANVFYYIPNRFNEGYGPNQEAFEGFVANDFKVVVTVDNGITGINEAMYLKKSGIDLIITDHHEQGVEIPSAYAILHPKLTNEHYPFKELSGSGVSFKLAHALLGYLPIELMDLACLGTYADMVSVKDENRGIVRQGLKQMRTTENLGLRLLIQCAKIKVIDEFALGYVLGPRLNAPGRMDDGNLAVRLLVTEDFKEAQQLVESIENLNNERKAKIDTIIKEAIDEIDSQKLAQYNVIVCSKPDWHEGVLGIICNRLVDYYHKPIILLSENEGLYKGSCRTLEEFPLYENLEKCSDLLEKFGGHKMAAGLSLKKENIDLLRLRLHALAGNQLNNYLDIDCILGTESISLELTNSLQRFRPFGTSNENPKFLLNDFEITSSIQIGDKKQHLKLNLKKNNLFLTAIAFNMGNLFYNINNQDKIDVVGTFEINEYNNKITNQLHILDIRCQNKQIFDYRKQTFHFDTLENSDFLYLYFNKAHEFEDAVNFSLDVILKTNVVLIDIPTKWKDLEFILKHPSVQNIYLLFKYDELFSYEDLITREKMGRIYQLYKQYQKFNRNDIQIISQLEKMGYDKKLQNISLEVFFELNFVIIKDNEIIVVDNPEKRSLTESRTYQKIMSQVEIKEKLLLTSSLELKLLLNKLINVEVI